MQNGMDSKKLSRRIKRTDIPSSMPIFFSSPMSHVDGQMRTFLRPMRSPQKRLGASKNDLLKKVLTLRSHGKR